MRPSTASLNIENNIAFFSLVPRTGLDLTEGVVRDNRAAGVLEPTISKIKSLKFATEAAIVILRIDDLIRLERA